MKFRTWTAGLAVMVASPFLFACPDDDPERFPVDEEMVPEKIEADLRNHREAAVASTGWVAETRIWQQTGLPAIDPPTDENEEEFESFLTFLTDYVFVDEHIERQTDASITYLLDGERICDGLETEFDGDADLAMQGPATMPPTDTIDDFVNNDVLNDEEVLGEFAEFSFVDELVESEELEELEQFQEFDREQCVRDIDESQLRLHVTSPFPNRLRIGMRVGEPEHEPVAFTVAHEFSLTEIDLEQTREALLIQRDRLGEERVGEIPDVLEGEIRSSFEIENDDRTRNRLSIQETIVVEDPEFRLRIEDVDPLVDRRADGDARELETAVETDLIEINFALADRDARLALDGLEFESFLSAEADDELQISGLRTDEPLRLFLDGDEVASIDLATADGGPVDMTLRATDDDTVLTFLPSAELSIDFQFGEHADDLGIPAWMRDDTWIIRLDDADEPTVSGRAENGLVQIVDGTLTLSSAQAGISLQLHGDECLMLGGADAPSPDDPPTENEDQVREDVFTDLDEHGDLEIVVQIEDIDPVDDAVVPTGGHPLDGMDAGSCP